MMLPILISVSVAPTSYFFCASVPLLVAASIARAAERAPNRNWIAGILISLISVECVNFFDWERFSAPARIEYPPQVSIKKKPPATGSQGASFSRTIGGHGPVKRSLSLLEHDRFGKPVPTFPDQAFSC